MAKLTYRKAKPQDVPAIVELAVLSVQNDAIPVFVDRAAMRETAMVTLNPAHFMWVAEDDGKIVAAVAACVQRSFWYRGMQASVLLYYSSRRGAGLGRLLLEFAKWCKSRSGIKVAAIELEPGTDPRLVKFLKRAGFARESLNLTYVRGI